MTITRQTDRQSGGSIVADTDDSEFDNIITELNSHTDASTAVHGVTGDMVGTNDTQTLTNKTLGDVGGTPSFTGQYASTANALTDGATIAIDWDDANVQYVTLTGTGRTVTLANPKQGGRYVLVLVQDGTGSRTITTWPTIKWVGGSAPTLTTTASHIDIITFIYANSVYYGAFTLDFS